MARGRVISFWHAKPPEAADVLTAFEHKKSTMRVDEQAEARIKRFLFEAYRPEAGDPAYVGSDMVEITHYYAQYPQVIALIDLLQGRNWC